MLGPLKMPKTDETGGLAPDAASWLGISTHVKRYDIFSRVLLGLFSGQEIPV